MSSRSTVRRTVAGGLATLGVLSASFVASTGTASALEQCPPGQTPFWNGKNCVMQLCNPPYNPGFPPCTMPIPTHTPVPGAPAGTPGSIPGQPF